MSVTAASLGLSQSQFNNARGIIAAVKAKAMGWQAAVIAIEVALTESGMRMIASANVPASQLYPYERLAWTSDGLGHDHASCGMFQQQTGWKWCPNGYGWNMNQTTMASPNGWGTPAELMNAEKSTEKFLNALLRDAPNYKHMPRWLAGQRVQGSAFPDGSNYRQQDARAWRIVHALYTVTSAPAPKPVPKPKPPVKNPVPKPPVKKPVKAVRIIGTYTVQQGDTLTRICWRYPQAWITPASVAKINGLSSLNHIYAGQKLRIGGTP